VISAATLAVGEVGKLKIIRKNIQIKTVKFSSQSWFTQVICRQAIKAAAECHCEKIFKFHLHTHTHKKCLMIFNQAIFIIHGACFNRSITQIEPHHRHRSLTSTHQRAALKIVLCVLRAEIA
jgi:hypothetical protein